MVVLTPCSAKRRRRLMTFAPMEADTAKSKLVTMAEKLGREIHVFETSTTSLKADKYCASSISNEEEPDDFYELTAEDYYQLLATRKEDKFLKTRKIREAEEAAYRSKLTKCMQAVIRVRFPDNYTLEAKFHPSETFQSLIDLLMKVIARPDLPFFLYTTPPKEKITEMSVNFHSAGFVPGAIVYFSYDLPQGYDIISANSGPFLREEIMSLNGLDLILELAISLQSAPEPVLMEASPIFQGYNKPVEKKQPSNKPKWFKM